jgi:hypothetical protein
MRIEVLAAYILGVLLPVAEVCRRRTDFSDIPAYVDDFILGAILLLAARSVTKQRAMGPILLVAAWGIFCGGMYASFFGQVARASSTDVSGLTTVTVVIIKGVLYLFGIIALVRSVQAAASGGKAPDLSR